MKKKYFAFIVALFIICCTVQTVQAKPQFKNFFHVYDLGSGRTFIDLTVVDRDWELANKTIYISLYDNKRRLIDVNHEKYINIWREAFGKPRIRIPKCTWSVTLTDTGPNYDGEYFVKYSNGQYQVRFTLSGRHQIAGYRVEWY